MGKPFYNEKRSRMYGIRVGDLVRLVTEVLGVKRIIVEGYVVEDGGMDNNACYVQPKDGGDPIRCVAEWLIILVPVEAWFPGKQGGSIVTKDPFGQPPASQESLDFYGGYVIAESIPPPFVNLICAAPTLLKAVEMFERMDNDGSISIWSDKRQTMNQALRIVRHGYDNKD